jgi:uncharacterized protein
VDLDQFKKQSENLKKENRQYFNKLKLRKPKDLDAVFHEAHEETFTEMDCLTCANCCKTTSPIFYPRDIDRAAKATRMKPGDFIEKYLRVDEDKDYVLQKAPCPFLGSDNYCSIYEDRPNACREYPHTDRKKMIQVMDLTYKNTLVCPAVLKIVEEVKRKLKL